MCCQISNRMNHFLIFAIVISRESAHVHMVTADALRCLAVNEKAGCSIFNHLFALVRNPDALRGRECSLDVVGEDGMADMLTFLLKSRGTPSSSWNEYMLQFRCRARGLNSFRSSSSLSDFPSRVSTTLLLTETPSPRMARSKSLCRAPRGSAPP